MPEYLTTLQAAERLQVDRSTLSRWVTLGKLKPAIRLAGNGQMLFDPADLDDFAAGADAQATA